MFLLEYMIKLLMGNSDTIFLGLLIVLFGYYGWLLWNIYHTVNDLETGEIKIRKRQREILESLVEIYKSLSVDIPEKFRDQTTVLEQVNDNTETCNKNVIENREKIISDVKEESGEVKEIVKILLGYYLYLEKSEKNALEKDKIE